MLRRLALPRGYNDSVNTFRFIRTLRRHTGMISNTPGAERGWPAIKRATVIYNEQVHGVTGEKPIEAIASVDVRRRVLDRILMRNMKAVEQWKKPKFKVGDLVRIKEEYQENAFAKSSKPRFTRSQYRVVGIKSTAPRASYYLESVLDKARLPGSFSSTWLH